MQEWFNWLAWKASIPQKGIGGSNPPLSAKPIRSIPDPHNPPFAAHDTVSRPPGRKPVTFPETCAVLSLLLN